LLQITSSSELFQVFVSYRGTLKADGKEFDSNLKGDPITFELGQKRVIEGWEQGLLGTCPGESIKLEIPSSLGYGAEGSILTYQHITNIFNIFIGNETR
jgi:FKBP-type peptidyl-prolyl cis-trans isomerase